MPFSRALVSSDPMFTFQGMDVVLARALTRADDGLHKTRITPSVECSALSLAAQRAKRLTEFFGMIEKVLFLAAVLLPGLACCGDFSADQARADADASGSGADGARHYLLHGNSLRHFSAGG